MDANVMNPTNLDYYLDLDYPIQLQRRTQDNEIYWIAEIPDLPGCMADGLTPEEAIEHVNDAKQVWIESCIEDNLEIPEPSKPYEYSGKFLLRLPKSLHERLIREAKHQGVSLNQFVATELASASGSSDALREMKTLVEKLNARVDTWAYGCRLLFESAERRHRPATSFEKALTSRVEIFPQAASDTGLTLLGGLLGEQTDNPLTIGTQAL